MSDETLALARSLGETLLARNLMLAVAESCTGGAVSATITEVSGSSDWFDRGFVTYSNDAKEDMLGVPEQTLESEGAVSEAAAMAMAVGAIAYSQADVSVAITGIAGPTGGTPDKPVGTVWFAWHVAGETAAERCLFTGDRAAVRAASVQHALQGLLQRLRKATH